MKYDLTYDRRKFLKFLGYGGAVLSSGVSLGVLISCQRQEDTVFPSVKDDLVLASGLDYSILIAWGDKINDQEVFGFNNDYINFFPLSNDDLIMWVNHEYVHPLFISGWDRSKENIEKEMALVGGSLIRVKKSAGKWEFVPGNEFNRGLRGNTPIPFAGGVKIKDKDKAIGTVGNCAGGKTPWNTILTCEENYHIFYGERQKDGSVKGSYLQWEKRFPHPPEHYGWVVEVDPKTGKAKKHTTLGRFSHECATCSKTKDGNVVVYSADDKNDEHLYKFVSRTSDSFNEGVLYVADLSAGKWLPLDLELSPKLKEKFKTQLEVMINCREAAKMLGATELDRPEDIEIHPLTGDVFVSLTNNKPKGNYHGQILKVKENGSDHGSLEFKSEVFHTGGEEGGFSCPDNMAFDKNGNLWICTDISGGSMGKKQYKSFGNNGLFVIPAKGPDAGRPIQVASAPVDAELTGLCFSPDQKALFLSVQHPGETSKDLENPTSRWPSGGIPKSCVVSIQGKTLDKYTS